MNAINTNTSSYMDTMKKDYESSAQVQTSSSKLNVTQKKNAEMEIVTRDGDRVTLSFASRDASGYQTYNQKGITGDGTAWSTSGQSEYSEFGLNIGISIDGSLDKEEFRDIMKAAKNLEKAMDKLVAGDTDEAVATLIDAAGGKTISSLESTVSFMRSVEIEDRYQSMTLPEPDAGETAESLPEANEKNMGKSAVEKAVDEVKEALSRARESVNKNLDSFENLFDRMFDKAEKNAFRNSGIQDFLKDIRKNLLEGLMNGQNTEKDMDV